MEARQGGHVAADRPNAVAGSSRPPKSHSSEHGPWRDLYCASRSEPCDYSRDIKGRREFSRQTVILAEKRVVLEQPAQLAAFVARNVIYSICQSSAGFAVVRPFRTP